MSSQGNAGSVAASVQAPSDHDRATALARRSQFAGDSVASLLSSIADGTMRDSAAVAVLKGGAAAQGGDGAKGSKPASPQAVQATPVAAPSGVAAGLAAALRAYGEHGGAKAA